MIRLLLAALLFSVFTPAPAQASWIEFFFPMLKKEEVDPRETLIAPFAQEEQEEGAEQPERPADNNLTLLRDAANAVPLDTAHRKDTEVAQWLMMAVSEALAFEPQDVEAQINANDPYFSTNGKKEYAAFLDQAQITKAVRSGQYRVRNFVREEPLVLNKAPVAGRYRWLLEVSVMVSYLDAAATNYENVEPVNQEMKLNIQVGRVEEKRGDHNLVIERWSGRVQKLER